MKKFMLLILLATIFVACDYTKDALDLSPDIEITYINPVAWFTYAGDSTFAATIAEIYFVPENSLDSYLKEYSISYYINDSLVYGPTNPIPVYGKISGIVTPGVVDTFILIGVQVPLGPARDRLGPNESAEAILSFVAIDEYFENSDTASVWFGIWRMY